MNGKPRVRWQLSVVVLPCLIAAGHAAAFTKADAIAIAKKQCAKQVADQPTLKWDAVLLDKTWAVSALPDDGNELKGWLYTIPATGPRPKACERYTIYRAMGLHP